MHTCVLFRYVRPGTVERMISTKRFMGEMLPASDQPVWEPLEELAGKQVEGFMWMFEVELEDGRVLHAYKHYWTRGYIHLTLDGRAFVYQWSGELGGGGPSWYQEVDPVQQLDLVLPHGERLAEYRELLECDRQNAD